MARRAVAIQTSSPLTAFPPPEGLRRSQARAHTDRASSPTHFKASPVSLSSAELVLALTLALQALHATFPPFEGLASSSCALPGQKGTIFPAACNKQNKHAAPPGMPGPARHLPPTWSSLHRQCQGSIPCSREFPPVPRWSRVQSPVSGSPFAPRLPCNGLGFNSLCQGPRLPHKGSGFNSL